MLIQHVAYLFTPTGISMELFHVDGALNIMRKPPPSVVSVMKHIISVVDDATSPSQGP